MQSQTTAVVYLARGYDADHITRFQRFVESYQTHSAGFDHQLYIIFKGFFGKTEQDAAEALFVNLKIKTIYTDDLNFDLGAYSRALKFIDEHFVCFLNTNSEISSSNWLYKLIRNLDTKGVGMVGATGSYESLNYINPFFPKFPNPHLRSNAFAMRREDAVEILNSYVISSKLDAFFAESGPEGLTRQVFERGLTCLIVGANGRGYPPQLWPESETSRQGAQANILVHDNYTRSYENMNANDRMNVSASSWGRYIHSTVF